MIDNIAISVKNITKTYKLYDSHADRVKETFHPLRKKYHNPFNALTDVSFDVNKGETLGIIGRNGSGKSTLLQIICGILQPSSGSVVVNGRVSALLELGAGFNPEFTGRQNVYINGSILGLKHEEIENRFDKIASFADIGDFLDQPVKTYSSGMAVRLAFAVAINVDPQILVVDEALSVGDELFQRKCYSRIESIKNSGTTILFVSHSATTVVELCDRTILLDDGDLLTFGEPKLIVGKYQKLLYAPLLKRKEILKEIRSITQDEHQEQPPGVIGEPANNNLEQEQVDDPDEFFDPHLVPTSMFEFESQGIYISKPQIKDLHGRQINNLVRNRKYKYSYQVKFDRPASCVRFGMLVKTTSGFPLGGALSAPSLTEAIPFVEVGSTVFVEFVFNCYVNPGLYFLNAGVFGSIEQEETVLHRIVDAVAFRVLPLEHNIVTEIIDFGFVPEISINERLV
jgi:homopolymeric O-antigen transport system ATP-binding protein